MKKIYYAGKISKNDWRHEIYTHLREVDATCKDNMEHLLTISTLTYNGPYFIGCDHGCFHGENTHGVGVGVVHMLCDEEVFSKSTALNNCLNEIKSSDIVFAYINSVDCYGTISEIGYAKAIGKPIYIVLDNTNLTEEQIKDLWFVLKMAKKVVNSKRNIVLEHELFVKWVETNSHLNKEKSNLASEKQINFIKILAEKYNYEIISIENMDSKEAGYIIDYIKGNSPKIPDCMYKYFNIDN